MTTIYDFSAKTITGKEHSLDQYKGNVLLIVNTASKCGFTPQFKDLQELYEKYKDRGLVILGFPSDQFMKQEFEDDEEIKSFCQVNYGVSFPMFSKVKVRGSEAHPLFQFLTSQQKGLLTKEVKWNFTKFLVNKDGKIIDRYGPNVKPSSFEQKIQKLLEE